MASTNRDEISRLELLHAAHPDGLVFPHLADAYRRAGRYAQAESVLNAGLRRHADYSSAHVVLGRLRLDQGKRREAESAFRHVLRLDPNNHVALEYLGRLTAEEGRAEEAVGYLRRLASIKPDDDLAERIAALEQQAQEAREAPDRGPSGRGGDPASARPGHEEAETSPGPRRENGAEGEADPSRRRPESGPAGHAPRNVPATLPEPGEVVTETMAELYARQGLHERAEAVYRKLSERDPDSARLRQKLAETVARRRGDQGAPDRQDRQEQQGRPGADQSSEPAATPSIRSHLAGVLAWRSDREEGAEAGGGAVEDPREAVEGERERAETPPVRTDDDSEPWASTPASDPGPSRAVDALESEPERHGPVAPRDTEPWATAPVSEPEPWSTAPVSDPAPPPTAKPERGPVESPAGEETPASPRSRPGPTPADLGLAEDDLEGADARTRALIALTDMLVGLLEYRDPFFRGSSSLTRLLATNVADEMGLGASDRVNLALAAVLRDLGRLAMGGRLVETQKGSGTPEARRKIERHVDLALHLMEGIELPRSVTLAVRHHHERWDGAGYPDGLAGEEIPRLARVLAAVDSFAAMVSPRPYRLPRKVPDAARELREAAGTQYDPEVVDALLRLLARRDQPHLGFVQRHHILLVNPDQPGAVVTAAKLCTNGYLAEVAVDPDAARERLRRVPVAALVVSAETGADTAEELIRDLRLDPLFASLPIVAVDAESVGLRVRLLESGADVCFPPGISYGELQGTLGALVRRTLRSRETRPDSDDDEAPWLALQGDVQDFPLAWLLQVMKYDSRTAGVGIRTATDQGAIYIEKGDAVHAQIRGGARGEEALKTMLKWSKGRFTVQPDARPKERSIESSIMHLLLTQAVEEDHAAAGIFGAVSDHG